MLDSGYNFWWISGKFHYSLHRILLNLHSSLQRILLNLHLIFVGHQFSKCQDSLHCQTLINRGRCTTTCWTCPSFIQGVGTLQCFLWSLGTQHQWKWVHWRRTWPWPPSERSPHFLSTCGESTTLWDSSCAIKNLFTPIFCHLSQWWITWRFLSVRPCCVYWLLFIALNFITPFCCGRCPSGGNSFNLEGYMPGYLFQGAISTAPKKKPPNQYHPTWECHELNLWLIAWVEYQHSQDCYSIFCAPYDILSWAQHDLLVHTQISAITAPSSITKILDAEWAEKLYKVIWEYQAVQLSKPCKI